MLATISGPAAALPGLCEAYAGREPLAVPNAQITADDAIAFVENGVTFADGTRTLLNDLLTSGAPYWGLNGPGSSVLDVVSLAIVTQKVGAAVDRGDSLEGLCLVLTQGAEFASAPLLEGIGLGGLSAVAGLAALPITMSLDAFLSAADSAAWHSQEMLYFTARRLGYSHAQILARVNADDLFFDSQGWLLLAGDYCVLWGCGAQSLGRIPISGGTPAEVYGALQRIYDALQLAAQRQASVERIRAEIRAHLVPGLQVVPANPSWGETVSMTASGELITGLPDTAYRWDFGDGTTAAGPSVSHRYRMPGQYTLALSATDRNGVQHSLTRSLQVRPPPIDVSAPDGWDKKLRRFSTPSSDLVSDYAWSFDDGSPSVSGSGRTSVEHDWATAGLHQVHLQLTLRGGGVVDANWSGWVGPGTRYISGHVVSGHEVWTAGDYVVTGSISVSAGATLEIQPGARVSLDAGGSLSVHGTLLANGAVFTATDPEQPWGGIYIYGDAAAATRVENCLFEYGRGSLWSDGQGGLLAIQSSAPTIVGNTFRDSPTAPSGIFVYGAAPTLRANTLSGFSANGAAGIRVISSATPTIAGNTLSGNWAGLRVESGAGGEYRGNTLSGNTAYGLYYAGPALDAANNYWGAPSGPLDDSDDRAAGGWYNPTGEGDRVSDRVAYRPWLGSPSGDSDGDGLPDIADPDDDRDGVLDVSDNCQFVFNPDQRDVNGNGVGDACDRYAVTPSAGSNGSIDPSTGQVANHGATVRFTVTPNNGYSASVGGTCGGSLVGNTFTTNAVTGDCTVVASFTSQTFTITPSAVGNGTISPNTPQVVNPGATRQFIVSPMAGYSASVGGTCGGTLVGTTYTTNPITANCTVTASFIAPVCPLCLPSRGGWRALLH